MKLEDVRARKLDLTLQKFLAVMVADYVNQPLTESAMQGVAQQGIYQKLTTADIYVLQTVFLDDKCF